MLWTSFEVFTSLYISAPLNHGLKWDSARMDGNAVFDLLGYHYASVCVTAVPVSISFRFMLYLKCIKSNTAKYVIFTAMTVRYREKFRDLSGGLFIRSREWFCWFSRDATVHKFHVWKRQDKVITDAEQDDKNNLTPCLTHSVSILWLSQSVRHMVYYGPCHLYIESAPWPLSRGRAKSDILLGKYRIYSHLCLRWLGQVYSMCCVE